MKVYNYHFLFNKKTFISCFVILINVFILNASDRTDALDLQNKCDAESKIIEIPLKNFGEEKDIKSYEDGLRTIKMGKINVTQSKYIEAIALYKEYLLVQYNIYKNLAEKYIQRVEKLNKDSSNELVDFVDNQQVLSNFERSHQYLTSAKSSYITKHYDKVIGPCRLAKKYLFENYKLAGKEIPEDYKKDLEDINNKIYQ